MITKLIIKNYNPLVKKGVKSVEINTNDILNIIMGRNGFGKTSLLKELTPFPPDNSDYGPGGYKECHITVKNDKYVLKSSTGKSSEHFFILNGKNLNTGNTLLVQKELVKIHFKLTNNIKNVLTGLDVRDLFTSLSPVRRKDILMSVNPNDTSVALKVFDKLKGNYNSLKGALKNQRQRLIIEESRLKQLASMDSEKLKEEMKTLDEQIKNALLIHGELRNAEYNDLSDLKNNIGKILSSLIGSNTLVKSPKSILLSNLQSAQSNLEYYKNLELKLHTTFEELSVQLSGVELGNNNLESFKGILSNNLKMIDLNQEELSELEKKIKKHDLFLEDDVYKEASFIIIIEELINLIYGVQLTSDKEITSQKYADTKKKYIEVTIELENVTRQINDIVHTLNHFNKASAVDCPKCQHKFKVGFETFSPEKLNNNLSVLKERKEKLEKQENQLKDYLDENQGWLESMESLVRFARRVAYTKPIFKMITEYKIGKVDPSSIVNALRFVSDHYNILQTLEKLMRDNESVSRQIHFLENSDVETLFKRSEYVERELSSAQLGVRRSLNTIKDINKQLDIIRGDECLRSELSLLIEELKNKLIDNGKYRLKNRVEEIVNELSPQKDNLVESLIRSESLNCVIESIKTNIANMEKRESHTLALMDGLSPVKGLIGYLMNDFIKSVVANVNAIIKPIWTSQLNVLNCSVAQSDEDVDLNYAFPVITGNSDIPNKDIGMCSGGEREIINFAFRVVLRRYCGEECGVPLMMDEIGGMFDELHKGRFWGYIREQLRLDKLPQVFMITHNRKELANGGVVANYIALNIDGLPVDFEVNQKSIIK